MTEIGEILVEEEIIEEEEVEEVPAYEAFLNAKQVESLTEAGLVDKINVRAVSDEDLIKLEGIGPATIIKLREWAIGVVPEGDAIANCHLVFADENGDPIDIKPGDIIPAELGAERLVEKGRARWQ